VGAGTCCTQDNASYLLRAVSHCHNSANTSPRRLLALNPRWHSRWVSSSRPFVWYPISLPSGYASPELKVGNLRGKASAATAVMLTSPGARKGWQPISFLAYAHLPVPAGVWGSCLRLVLEQTWSSPSRLSFAYFFFGETKKSMCPRGMSGHLILSPQAEF